HPEDHGGGATDLLQADAFEPRPEMRGGRGVDPHENISETRERGLDQRARIGRAFGDDGTDDMPAAEETANGVAAPHAVTQEDIAVADLDQPVQHLAPRPAGGLPIEEIGRAS